MDNNYSHYIESENVAFRYAKGPSVEKGKEFHPFHEIIYFMAGDAEFVSEEIHSKVEAGTLIVVPKETYHQLVIHGNPNDYKRCTFKFSQIVFCEKSMTSQIFVSADKNIEYLLQKLITRVKDKDCPALLYAVLALLLDEISQKRNNLSKEGSQNAVIVDALNYINNRLHTKITTEEIAKTCMISPSSLSHIFKKEMGIPLHKFILKKRLISAYGKIENGESATKAAADCGFNDYSGFYKQYKKMFGASPSDKKRQAK